MTPPQFALAVSFGGVASLQLGTNHCQTENTTEEPSVVIKSSLINESLWVTKLSEKPRKPSWGWKFSLILSSSHGTW